MYSNFTASSRSNTHGWNSLCSRINTWLECMLRSNIASECHNDDSWFIILGKYGWNAYNKLTLKLCFGMAGLAKLCGQAGNETRAELVSPNGSGWLLHSAIKTTGRVGVTTFAGNSSSLVTASLFSFLFITASLIYYLLSSLITASLLWYILSSLL